MKKEFINKIDDDEEPFNNYLFISSLYFNESIFTEDYILLLEAHE